MDGGSLPPDEEIAQLLREAVTITDFETRKAAYDQINQLIFDRIRHLFVDHRKIWEDAMSSLQVLDSRLRIVATVPEKVMSSPSHAELPEVTALAEIDRLDVVRDNTMLIRIEDWR